jgi:hypothetical protein
MSTEANLDAVSVRTYLRDAQPVLDEIRNDKRGAELKRIAAVQWLTKYSRQNRGLDAEDDSLIDDFFIQEANRIASSPNPAQAFGDFLKGNVPMGRPPKADPETFGTIDMVNARLAIEPKPTIDQACAAVADELGQSFESVRRLYYKWRAKADEYKAVIEKEKRAEILEADMLAESVRDRRDALETWDSWSEEDKKTHLSNLSPGGVSNLGVKLEKARAEAQTDQSDRKSEGLSGD